MQVRPEEIRAFNREVWADCPAAPAAVRAVPLFTVVATGRKAAENAALLSRKTCLTRPCFAFRGDAEERTEVCLQGSAGSRFALRFYLPKIRAPFSF